MKKTNLFNLLGLATAMTLCSSLSLEARQRTIQLIHYDIRPNTEVNTAPLLHKAIEQISKEQGERDTLTLVLAPGRYYLSGEDAPERQVYISNHDQTGPRRIGLLLENLRNITIEGMGSDLICRERMLPVAILGCDNVSLRRLSIDFDNPQISQIKVVANGEEGLTFEPAHWVQSRRSSEGAFEVYGPNWHYTPFAGIAFDPHTRHMLYRTSDIGYSTKKLQVLPSGALRAPHWKDKRLVPGTIIAMRSYKRPNPGIFVAKSLDTKLSQIAVHYAEGMGILAQASHNITLDRFDVRLRGDADPRYFTTQADATHFSGCSGHIDVRNGLYEAMMDDAINVHGVYLKLIKRVDDYTIIGRYMHDQAWGMEWGLPGEEVQFIQSKTFDMLPSRYRIKSIRPHGQDKVDGAKEFEVRFSQRLPREVNPDNSIGIENLTRTPSVTFSGNTIRNNRARGTLFNTPRLVLVENNLFDHVSGSGILVSTDCNLWFESGQTKNLKIRGNYFIDVLTSLYQFTEAVISIYPIIPNLKGQKRPFYGDGTDGITIEDNVFMTFDTPLLFAISTDGILWRRNKVMPTTSYQKFHHNQEVYKTIGSRAIRIED